LESTLRRKMTQGAWWFELDFRLVLLSVSGLFVSAGPLCLVALIFALSSYIVMAKGDIAYLATIGRYQ
jgi:hypothetical protein